MASTRSLREVPASQIIAAVADAAARWRDADFPPRVRATRSVMERMGYSEPVVDYALDRLFGGATREALEATIASELGSVAALDDFVARAGRPDVWYRGVARATLIASDTTIGVAIPHLLFALCAKANVIVKDRSDALVSRFAETLCDERPEIESALVVDAWSSQDALANARALAGAQTVIAFANDSTLGAIREHLDVDALFMPFGHRTSIGLIAQQSLAALDVAARDALACAIARDALLYDGEGCLSLHALFIEVVDDAGDAVFDDLASRIAHACDEHAIEFPAGSLALDPRTASYRARALFRASQGAGKVAGGAGAPYVIAARAPLDEPQPLAPRTLALYRVENLDEAGEFVRHHRIPLEAVAYAASRNSAALDSERREVAVAQTLGAARICRLGDLQDPPLTGNHGGAGRILPFVRPVYRDR